MDIGYTINCRNEKFMSNYYFGLQYNETPEFPARINPCWQNQNKTNNSESFVPKRPSLLVEDLWWWLIGVSQEDSKIFSFLSVPPSQVPSGHFYWKTNELKN